MKNVLYEVHCQLRFANILPVLFIVFLIIWPRGQNGKGIFHNPLRMVGIVLMLLLLVGITENDLEINSELVSAYRREEYKTVQGYVEQFVSASPQGHTFESFEINGIRFMYTNGCFSSGYCVTKSHGGVIHQDGQYLKIGYVETNTVYDNIILYIEEIKSKSE